MVKTAGGEELPIQKKAARTLGEPGTPEFRVKETERPGQIPPPFAGMDLSALLESIAKTNDTLELILQAHARGLPEENFFDTGLVALTASTPNRPENPNIIAAGGNPGYDRIQVYESLTPSRNAPRLSVINDGSETLYVLQSSDGENWTSVEVPILVGEARILHNVYELRVRGPAAGNITTSIGGIYRATEYDYWLAYSTNPNRSQFTGRRLAVPFPAPGSTISTLLGATLQIPSGFSLTIRSYIYNAALSSVFVSGSIPEGVPANPPVDAVTNVGAAGTRITLAPGDVTRLFVRNTDRAAILGSVGGLFVDILVEQ